MDEVKKTLESELSRTVERLRQMGGPVLSVDITALVAAPNSTYFSEASAPSRCVFLNPAST